MSGTLKWLSPNQIIRFTKRGSQGNPKRPNSGAHELYEAYEDGMTVEQYYVAAAKTRRPDAGKVAIAWDVAHGFIIVT